MPPEGFEPPRARGPRRSGRRAYAFRHGGVLLVRVWLRRESNSRRAGLQPAALPVSYRSRAESATKPTGLEPACSRATVGRAGHCATASTSRHGPRWHDERMTPPPGSRVISCENAIRPPATPMARVSCDTHASIGCQRAGAPFQKRRSPHPASCTQVGRSRIPSGDGRGPWTSRPRVVPSRLHAVVPRIR